MNYFGFKKLTRSVVFLKLTTLFEEKDRTKVKLIQLFSYRRRLKSKKTKTAQADNMRRPKWSKHSCCRKRSCLQDHGYWKLGLSTIDYLGSRFLVNETSQRRKKVSDSDDQVGVLPKRKEISIKFSQAPCNSPLLVLCKFQSSSLMGSNFKVFKVYFNMPLKYELSWPSGQCTGLQT